ncbi:Cdc6/Cdc18 family protein [Halobellus rarus]|uniref:Cdc6/Cdc18 family protein n=1 Tax=Halobellus rarus TaxID=1126237 RepID=A0ABD6CNF4_9EURY|nr:Cdc6/Cdc18 family protein [Halobellus rarus]
MIRDARALRDEFVPQELQHRNNEIDLISSCLRPIEEDLNGEHTLITGPSGAGKTTLAKYVCQQLERQTLDVRIGYVNCLSANTSTGVLHTLLRDARIGRDFSRESTPRSRYFDRIRDSEYQLVFILDEVDVLDDYGSLLSLYDQPNVTLVMVCIDEDAFLSDVDMRVQSRVRAATSVRLEKYHDEEVVDIVTGRAEAGLAAGVLDEGTCGTIADLAAGDARMGIALLRRAAERAEEEGLDHLSPGLIEAVSDSATTEVHDRNVELLSTHQRLLYEIISEAGEIGSSELHREYEEQSSSPKSRSTRRRYLDSLERYGLIEQRGSTRDSRYEVTKP